MIPILINNRDLLESVIEQFKFFLRCPEASIHIIDNGSTYPPLLEWYNMMTGGAYEPGIEYRARTFLSFMFFHFLPGNGGPRMGQSLIPFIKGEFDYYFMSDADMDYSDIDPTTFLSDLQAGLERYPQIEGASASIRIDDLPDTNMAKLARQYEAANWGTYATLTCDQFDSDTYTQYYSGGSDVNWYLGLCDTAGVLRRVVPQWQGGYSGIRSTKHIARHRPWYFISDEQDLPHCELCGYTQMDQSIHGDHKIYSDKGGSIPRGERVPQDFRHFYAHADPSGTAYTSFMLDGGRNK